MYKRQEEVSRASKCPLNALPVQQPFHLYEETLYKTISAAMSESDSISNTVYTAANKGKSFMGIQPVSNIFVEPDPMKMMLIDGGGSSVLSTHSPHSHV